MMIPIETIDQLAAENKARRMADRSDAEQLRVDLTLARNECARLRGVIKALGEWWTDHSLSTTMPRDVQALVDARFPTEAA